MSLEKEIENSKTLQAINIFQSHQNNKKRHPYERERKLGVCTLMAGRYTASSFAGSLGVAVVTWYGQRWRELFRGKRKFEFRRTCCLWFLDLAPPPPPFPACCSFTGLREVQASVA